VLDSYFLLRWTQDNWRQHYPFYVITSSDTCFGNFRRPFSNSIQISTMSLQLDCHTALLAIKAGLSSSNLWFYPRTAPAISKADKMTPHYSENVFSLGSVRGVAELAGGSTLHVRHGQYLCFDLSINELSKSRRTDSLLDFPWKFHPTETNKVNVGTSTIAQPTDMLRYDYQRRCVWQTDHAAAASLSPAILVCT